MDRRLLRPYVMRRTLGATCGIAAAGTAAATAGITGSIPVPSTVVHAHTRSELRKLRMQR
jgi:hypothetical protein